jgi:hypothetical protein
MIRQRCFNAIGTGLVLSVTEAGRNAGATSPQCGNSCSAAGRPRQFSPKANANDVARRVRASALRSAATMRSITEGGRAARILIDPLVNLADAPLALAS